MMLRLVCGVLCVQLGLLGQVFFLRSQIHTDTLHTPTHTQTPFFFKHLPDQVRIYTFF